MLSFQNQCSSLDVFLTNVFLSGLIEYEKNHILLSEFLKLKEKYEDKNEDKNGDFYLSFKNIRREEKVFENIEKILNDYYGDEYSQVEINYFQQFFNSWKDDDDSFWLESKLNGINLKFAEMLLDSNRTTILTYLDVNDSKPISSFLEKQIARTTLYRKIPELIENGFVNVFEELHDGKGRRTTYTKTFDSIDIQIKKTIHLKMKIHNNNLKNSQIIKKLAFDLVK